MAFPRRKGVCTKTYHLNWQPSFSFTFFKEEKRRAASEFICVWYKELQCTMSMCLEPCLGKKQWGKKLPRTHREGYLTMHSSNKGNPNKNKQLLRLMGWNRFFGKLPVWNNPQETNGSAGYVKTQAVWHASSLQWKVTHDGNMEIREQCEGNLIRPPA